MAYYHELLRLGEGMLLFLCYKTIHNILFTFILTYIVINITLTFPEVNKHAQVLTLADTLKTEDCYCQIPCIALRVWQTSKGFWVFLLRQSFELGRG